MHPGRARLDHPLHELEGVKAAAESGLGVGDQGHEPVRAVRALCVMDLVGSLQGLIDAADELRNAVGRIEALIRIYLARHVGVRCDLPAAHVDRMEPGLYHLHGLIAAHRAESAH